MKPEPSRRRELALFATLVMTSSACCASASGHAAQSMVPPKGGSVARPGAAPPEVPLSTASIERVVAEEGFWVGPAENSDTPLGQASFGCRVSAFSKNGQRRFAIQADRAEAWSLHERGIILTGPDTRVVVDFDGRGVRDVGRCLRRETPIGRLRPTDNSIGFRGASLAANSPVLPEFPYENAPQAAPSNPGEYPRGLRGTRNLGVFGQLTWAEDGTIQRTTPSGARLFTMGFPDATDVLWEGERFVVNTPAGSYVLSPDGELLEYPRPAVSAPFEMGYRFERLRESNVSLEQLWNGRIFALVDGRPSEYKYRRFAPLPAMPQGFFENSEDSGVAGLLHLPNGQRLVIGWGQEPGTGAEVYAYDTGRRPWRSVTEIPRSALPYPNFITATSQYQTAWATASAVMLAHNQDQFEQLDYRGDVAALLFHRGQLWVAGSVGMSGHSFDFHYSGKAAAGFVPFPAQSEYGYVARWDGATWVAAPYLPRGEVTALGSLGASLWIAGAGFLVRCDGERQEQSCREVQNPLTQIHQFFTESPTSLWAAGDGGIAHYDGAAFRRIPTAFGNARYIVGTADGELLVSTTQGVFRGRRGTGARPDDVGDFGVVVAESGQTPTPGAAKPTVLAVGETHRFSVTAFPLPRLRGQRYRPNSLAIAGGAMWLSDGRTDTTFDPQAQALVVRRHTKRAVACTHCIAEVKGRAVTIAGGVFADRGAPAMLHNLRSLRAAANTLWAVADRETAPARPERTVVAPSVPEAQLIRREGAQVMLHVGLPAATYWDLAVASDEGLWLVGSLSPDPRPYRRTEYPRESGEGCLVHYGEGKVTQYRVPGGALLAVDTDGDGGAWAVGVAGQIAWVKDTLRLYTVPRNPWLRAVLAVTSTELWVAGDRSTLLHFDGRGWERVYAPALVPDQSLTGLAVDAQKRLWVLGENVLYRVERGVLP